MFDKIKELCNKRNISVLQLEREVGLTHGIHRWDTNKPSIDKVKAVADYFGVSVDYLLSDEEDYDETEVLKQKLFDTPGMRVLFSATDGATEDDLMLAARMLEVLKSSRNK